MSPRLILALLFASLSIGAILSGPDRSPASSIESLTPTPSLSVEPTPETTASPEASISSPPASETGGTDALDLLGDLVVAAERREGYVRERFRHWIDDDRDGCDTRREVLIEESLVALTVGDGCSLSNGRWFSSYDARETTDPLTLDIDHLVPLAEAWDSGAYAWDDARREAFANDLSDPRSLIAVSASSNRSKGDRDPGEWLPNEEYRCRYATEWVAVKRRWSLAIDPLEQGALTSILRACSLSPISVEIVP